ncbi:phosphoenolpyruvate carboxykinase (GTP) [Curtobacterium flaccumfaciens pv. flaccumfaciens]|uniref:phosphoenolpyruvate carboxykinase (GTP) n=1 Tax=Curtobacterium TaxID=2034 RepID=UPI00217ECE8D|nr:phosphoenolpyruvate carboxykinase (GTP) [Curtobacterium flaccumfaciens]MCS6553304.1 phosphoenolpyruvate carboxykinase (GTP) [Curtobacterium flaccumfaciens pv. flaccumfaciens]MCS6567124.1 phosphoenolpyruvate carboxykinase (GTP) [Curtobacterium flaccumfaciens pv. flaccumfaciens]MCS6570446.1 phosphoenolpyruvate carboxykinase (GTP) [Curtobacterium flaccumfaciens pv. flaccumfaciens]MCS6586871.1 phosphoenolpyruvate carboxykinase (GTP) [Curtobacterium flaccumfaciens pv. flaccumfaciens]
MITNPNHTTPAPATVPGSPRVALEAWVAEVASLTRPDTIVWCDGSPDETARLTQMLVDEGKLIALDPERRPNSYLARSAPSDVARVEGRTFTCSRTPEDAGPTNLWRDPTTMRSELRELFAGSMRGRTMYVVPFSMGPVDGPISQLGVEITDSAYVVLSMGKTTRLGPDVLRSISAGTPWVATVHSVGHPLRGHDGALRDDVAWPCNETKYIVQFPETREVWSYGSGYGGNALLAKKCFALRIASVIGRDEGWLAEHMLLIRLNSPEGRSFHIAAAFPSACGKTNLAMLQPTLPGWSVDTIGDDIAWLRPGPDGRLHAINPEAGLFGVAPGTGTGTNPVAVQTIAADTIFTNVALTDDGDVWWEGLTPEPPAHLVDWTGADWTPERGTPAAHPNARFTVGLGRCPSLADDWEQSVPIDAVVFGGRRSTNVPLVAQASTWSEGVFMGATMSSEQTAAAEGAIGELRRDPFAMLPFCGYDMARHWAHWLEIGDQLGSNAPAVFQVNWFRKGDDGRYLWPGFGENARVLEWIARRIEGRVPAIETPIGLVPDVDDLDVQGLALPPAQLNALFAVDPASWLAECDLTEEFLATFDERTPPVFTAILDERRASLRTAASTRQAV